MSVTVTLGRAYYTGTLHNGSTTGNQHTTAL